MGPEKDLPLSQLTSEPVSAPPQRKYKQGWVDTWAMGNGLAVGWRAAAIKW